jgi:hypothetical protein
MRTIRALRIAAAIVVALPTMAAAQHGREFKDSWFWGIKAGGLTFGDSGQAYRQAPLAGIDWLITRSKGGLYVSGGQAFFHEKTVTFRDPNFPVDSGFREIQLKNLRRLDVAVMGFPGDFLRFHPYVGAGFSVASVGDAEATGPFANTTQLDFANQVITTEKVQAGPMGIIGGQWRFKWASAFGQLTVSTAHKDFILYNGRPLNLTYEFGLRYNVGTSIDRQY